MRPLSPAPAGTNDLQRVSSIVIGPDATSPAGFTLRTWTGPAGGLRLVELVAQDTETLARVRLDLSVAQTPALAQALVTLGEATR